MCWSTFLGGGGGGTDLPALIYGFFGGKKKIKFLFPAATEENIARVNLLRKASDSSILMAIDALDAILSIHLLPLAKI
jgi:hypothetical protein